MPDKSGRHSDRKHRHRRSHEHARSPFADEDTLRPKDKRSRGQLHEDSDTSAHNDGYSTKETSGGRDISLSVKETNALRAKLGLAPLELNESGTNELRVVDNQSENYVHAPAKDFKKLRETEAIKENLSTQKDKRTLYDKLANSRLYEPEERDLSVNSWVDKIREKEKTKKQAVERAKLLCDMDDQLNSDTGPHLPDISVANAYRSADLAGLKVEHKPDFFREGQSVILTLKDRNILEEEGETDVLVNVNIVDDEKAEINRENRRKAAGLAGMADEEDEDVLLGLKQKNILSKYDADISGTQKSQFTIDSSGVYVPHTERMLEQLHATLRAAKHSLPDAELRVASEYYTDAELKAKFKKRVRRTKVHRRTTLTTDDSLEVDSVDLGNRDLGRRSSQKAQSSQESGSASQVDLGDIDLSTAILSNIPFDANPVGDLSTELTEDDELRGELEKTISRVIKAKSAVYVQPEQVAAELLARKREETEAPKPIPTTSTNGNIVFDSTAEFYKTIGSSLKETMRQHARFGQVKLENLDNDEEDIKDITTVSSDWKTTKQEDHEKNMSMSEESDPEDPDKLNSSNRWHTVGQDKYGKRPIQSRPDVILEPSTSKQQTGVLDDEPLLDSGVFLALKLAEKKGYIEKGKEKRAGTGTMVNLMAKHYVQEEVRYDDIDAKFAKRDRYSGPLSEFKEIKHYKPDVKLEYVDELGRQLNAKEAFRQLSHKFHGKGSGKNKTENRMKRIKEEFLLKASTSSDTPLGTAEKLNKKLKSIAAPYVILSGKNAAVKHLTK